MRKMTLFFMFLLAGMVLQAAPLGVFPVTPRQKIRLEGTVQAAPKFDFDKRPELKQFFGTAVWFPEILKAPVAHVRWRFIDAKKKGIRPVMWSRMTVPVFSGKEQQLIIEVYPPEGAVKIELQAFPAGSVTGTFAVGTADDSTVNVNPDFALGPYNPCGWGSSSAKPFWRGALEPDAKGHSALNIQSSWAYADPFPVKPGMVLHVESAGIGGTSRRGRVGFVWLKDLSSKGQCGKTKSGLYISGTESVKTASGNYPVPKGVNWARISYNNAEFQYIRVTVKE